MHLIPSAEVSWRFIVTTTLDSNCSSERHAQYSASDYIPWKQLHLPWLKGIWSWCNWGDRRCLGIHWETVLWNWVEETAACYLVKVCYWLFTWPTEQGVFHTRYCIPMDGPRPLLDAELQFFSKGTGKGKFWGQLSNVMIFCWAKLVTSWLFCSSH